MRLKKLLKDIPIEKIKGSKEILITGVCANSKLVAPGNLFIARKGRTEDGSLYIPEAVAAGAVAVLTDIFDPLLNKDVTQIIVRDVPSIEGKIAANYYQLPSNELFMVGITGTNGKTTSSFLIKHLLDKADSNCGLIGTIECIIGPHRYKANLTTPDVSTNHKMLREMINQGCKSAVMEVTSHALSQNRVDGIHFDAAVFTNLTLDHLDYHHTMENYANAKKLLFRSLESSPSKSGGFSKTAIVNADSCWHQHMLEGCPANVITYGLSNDASLKAKDVSLSPLGTSMTLCFRGQQARLLFPLIGRFNVYNCLIATAVGLSRNLQLTDIADIMASAPPVPGRLQMVPNPLGLKIYVDFAHSEDSLINVLECLQEIKTKRIIAIFGCGGDRDTNKRPKMAKACEEHADIVILTSDNPRSEDPAEIARQAIKGFSRSDYFVELDRRKAIEYAINAATPEDIILIAGKGHETQQIFAYKTIEFDDYKVALELCKKLYSKQIAPNAAEI